MLTLAMPQSEPQAERKASASRTLSVKTQELRALGHGVLHGDRLIETGPGHDVEDGGEGLVLDHGGLRGHANDGGPDVVAVTLDAVAASDDLAALGHGLLQRRVEGAGGVGVDQRADEGSAVARVADGEGFVGLLQPSDQSVRDALVDQQTAQGGAALAAGADGREGDGPDRHVEVGGGGDDHRVVAAELQQRTAETGGDGLRDGPAHARGTGGRDQRDSRVGGEAFADVATADDDL